MTDALTAREERDLQRMTLALVETCVRNTGLEDLHAGRFPRSRTGDYSDVTVITPDGEIPWTEVSRISDEEMKALMIEVVDRVYTWVSFPEASAGLRTATGAWDPPKFDENMMRRVRRLQAGREIGDPDPDDTQG
jgi:hypothetical protein